MFGTHTSPLKVSARDITISVQPEGEMLRYMRTCKDTTVDKLLVASRAKLLICPVEPVNTPKNDITQCLQISFSDTLVVAPKAHKKVFVTFPVEIGVFLDTKSGHDLVDVFTLAREKYTLYGDVTLGTICKYWSSDVSTTAPSPDPLEEGVMELAINNTTNSWVKVTKVVFNAVGMHLYYGPKRVAMKTSMRVLGPESAETTTMDRPLDENMEKASELYVKGALDITATKFLMEDGL